MRPTNENSISEVIAEMLKKYSLEEGLWSAKIHQAWDKSLSEYIVKRTTSLAFSKGLLKVSVNSSVIRNELLLIKEDIRKQINDELGSEIVLDMMIF